MTNEVPSSRVSLGGVVVATDFSESSRHALERAARLPLPPGASLELLHVLPLDTEEAPTRPTLDEWRELAHKALDAAGHAEVSLFSSFGRGKPFVEIVRHARHGRAELIVVGRHGERTFAELLIGSTAERVVRKGDVSVLVVTTPAARAYCRPLVAVDGSDSSRLAIELTLEVCGPSVERVDVVNVLPAPGTINLTDARLVPQAEKRRLEEERAAREEFARMLDRVSSRVQWNLVLESGDPRSRILDLARRLDSDLIALGTAGRTGLAHVLIGSVAEGVLRAARCDVLVARLPRVDFRLP